MNRKLWILGTALLLSACSSTPPKMANAPATADNKIKLEHAYQYQLLNSATQPIQLDQMVADLSRADIVFIGEFHGNQASHLLQMQLLHGLYQHNQKLTLSLEMFNRDQQHFVDDYIDDLIGETYLVKEAPSWNNYKGSYRPMVEFAKQNLMPIIAANASADIVRCIGRHGKDYIKKLDDEERSWIASAPFADIQNYQEKFFDFFKGSTHLSASQKEFSYLAQITRDNTMAESIHQAWLASDKNPVVHLNGTFHSEDFLGTVGALKRIDPSLKILVITPVHDTSFIEGDYAKGDFYYLIKPQPVEYVSNDYKRKDRQAMFARSKAKACK